MPTIYAPIGANMLLSKVTFYARQVAQEMAMSVERLLAALIDFAANLALSADFPDPTVHHET